MARIRYRDINFEDSTLEMIVKMNQLLTEYSGRVTVRQLYYRCVGFDWIPNNKQSYNRFKDIAKRARYAGMLDWDRIEDRGRSASRPVEYSDGAEALDRVCSNFRLDRWADQPFYVETWCEKAALADVLAPISHDYHVTMSINRGYNSASAMKEAADRIRYRISGPNRPRPVIIYLGDHDPSGEDMVRDIRARLIEFGCPDWLDVRKLALTMPQVEEYKCPPNPTKTTDSRAAGYIEKHGHESWELDALPPAVLEKMLSDAVKAYIDKKKMDEVISRENVIKTRLRRVAAQLPK